MKDIIIREPSAQDREQELSEEQTGGGKNVPRILIPGQIDFLTIDFKAT